MSESGAGDLAAFRAEFGGRVVLEDDNDYDAVRAECVWNGDIDRRPWLIARVASTDDVTRALRLAADSGRAVAVRGGGHNFSGSCIADDAVMIDLGALCDITVDPKARRATCGGGTRWAQLDAATQEHGLAAPGGFISHTGVGGLTLGGGLGWLTRKAGLSSDNLLSAEVVTADGRILRAAPDEHPDLFWAIRGGGGNFGVVTKFEFGLHEVGPMVQLAFLFWGLDEGPEAFRAARDLAPSLPDDVTLFLAGLNAPPAPFVPEDWQFRPGYGILVGGFGSPEAHGDAVEALRRRVTPGIDFVTPIPYVALQQMFDESAPWGIRGYEKAIYLEELTDEVIEVIARHLPGRASPMTFMPTFVLGGEYCRHSEDESAFGGSRSIRYVLNIAAIAPDPELLETDRSWVRSFWAELSSVSGGVGGYVNFMSDLDQDRIRATYGDAKYERLRRIKADYDPDNVFRLNANIEPAAR